jgi:hypothetical protein
MCSPGPRGEYRALRRHDDVVRVAEASVRLPSEGYLAHPAADFELVLGRELLEQLLEPHDRLVGDRADKSDQLVQLLGCLEESEQFLEARLHLVAQLVQGILDATLTEHFHCPLR